MTFIESLPKDVAADFLQYRSLTKKVELILNDIQENGSFRPKKSDTAKRYVILRYVIKGKKLSHLQCV